MQDQKETKKVEIRKMVTKTETQDTRGCHANIGVFGHSATRPRLDCSSNTMTNLSADPTHLFLPCVCSLNPRRWPYLRTICSFTFGSQNERSHSIQIWLIVRSYLSVLLNRNNHIHKQTYREILSMSNQISNTLSFTWKNQ